MSASDAVRRLIQKGAVDKAQPLERYRFRERFEEFVVFDGYREIATCNDRKDAEDIVDAMKLLFKIEGKR